MVWQGSETKMAFCKMYVSLSYRKPSNLSHSIYAPPLCVLMPVPGKKLITGILLGGLEQDMDISLGHCVPISQNVYLICSFVEVSNSCLMQTIMWLAKCRISRCYILQVGRGLCSRRDIQGLPPRIASYCLIWVLDKIVFDILLFTHFILNIYIKFSC